MPMTMAQIETEALNLPESRQLDLVDFLLVKCNDRQIQEAWSEEAEARCRAIDEGRMSTIPHNDVMKEMRAGRKDSILRKTR